MDNKLKGVPVYLVALVLVVGSVAGAGIWFLTVDVPVDYVEPLNVNMTSEENGLVQYGVFKGGNSNFKLRDTHTHTQNANLTYSTYHQYVNFSNPSGGKDNLHLRVKINVSSSTNDLGFVVFNKSKYGAGEPAPLTDHNKTIEPKNVTWNYYPNDYVRKNASYSNEPNAANYTIYNDSVEFEITDLDTGQYWNRTIIYVVPDTKSAPTNLDTFEITWTFTDITNA